jgi:putative transcriptional regulator
MFAWADRSRFSEGKSDLHRGDQQSSMSDPAGTASVLESKRTATTYRILVAVATRQPAVNQREIAEAVGITTQAVSDYLRELADRGFVDKQGRGRYEITKEGVDWLISETGTLREFVEYVASEVLGEVEIETALATSDLAEGERVSLAMHEGVLQADPGTERNATAVTVTDAAAGEAVGVTNVEGVIDYDLGTVTVLAMPPVREGGSAAVDADPVASLAAEHDLVAVDAPEGLAAVRAAGLEPDIRFGTAEAVPEAATKGLDVLLLAASKSVSTHTETLRESNIGYELLDARD